MNYQNTLERIKKLKNKNDPPTDRTDKSPTFTPFVSFVSDPPTPSENFSIPKDEGRAAVVTVKDGRIQVVGEDKPINPEKVVAVWNFRRVKKGKDEWMIGLSEDGRAQAWSIRGQR